MDGYSGSVFRKVINQKAFCSKLSKDRRKCLDSKFLSAAKQPQVQKFQGWWRDQQTWSALRPALKIMVGMHVYDLRPACLISRARAECVPHAGFVKAGQTGSALPRDIQQEYLFYFFLKKVGKTIRPFRYDLNQIPYDYTVEVRNRFKGLDLIECLMNYGMRSVTLYRRQG